MREMSHSLKVRPYSRKSFLYAVFTMVAGPFLLLGCGDNPSAEKKGSSSDWKKAAAINICEILSGEEVGKTMGLAITEVDNVMFKQDEEGLRSASHCNYLFGQGASDVMSVTLRYDGSGSNPASMDDAMAGLTRGMDADMLKDVQNAQAVEGLGDLAISYTYYSPTLVVYFNKHYNLMITAPMKSDIPDIMEKSKQLASQIMQKVTHLKGTVKRKKLSCGEKRYVSRRAFSLSSPLPLPQFHSV